MGGIIIYKTLSDPEPTTVCQGTRLHNKCMSMHLNANANVLVTHLQMHLNKFLCFGFILTIRFIWIKTT